MSGQRIEPVPSVADRFLASLVENEVECIYLNPGTDTAPILESIARREEAGLPSPRLILCLHEAVALAAAHGHYMVSGRAQLVIVHVDVGTQNLGAMLHNVWRMEVGVVIFAGRTPLVSYGATPGRRDLPVHWQQDVPDQDAIVRPYAKLTMELRLPELVGQQMDRAFQLARSAPAGASYVTAVREVLMAPDVAAPEAVPSSPLAVPTPVAPAPEAVARLVQLIEAAARPLITTTRVGRDPRAVPLLVALAERLAAPVLDRRERLNFPSSHPLYLRDSGRGAVALADADLVIDIDSDVPWVPSLARPSLEAKVVRISIDPIRADSPHWSFPAELLIAADPYLALQALTTGLAESPRRDPWFQDRLAAATPASSSSGLIGPEELFETLGAALEPEDIVVEEVTTNAEAMRQFLPRSVPGTHFQSGGSGLGWATGAAVGAKIALPERRVVAVLGDGAFMFNNASVALWVSTVQNAPLLVIVVDNGGYAASRRPVTGLYPDGAYARSLSSPGTAFGDSPDFAGIARAGGYSARIATSRSQFAAAIAAARAEVDAGRGALVVARTTSPYFPA